MKIHSSFVAILFLTVVALSLTSAAKVMVELKDAQGKSVGSALMYESDGILITRLTLSAPSFKLKRFSRVPTPAYGRQHSREAPRRGR